MLQIAFVGCLAVFHRKYEAALLLSLHCGSQYRQEHAVQLMYQLLQRILVVVSPVDVLLEPRETLFSSLQCFFHPCPRARVVRFTNASGNSPQNRRHGVIVTATPV